MCHTVRVQNYFCMQLSYFVFVLFIEFICYWDSEIWDMYVLRTSYNCICEILPV